MKPRFIALIVALAAILTLAACGGGKPQPEPTPRDMDAVTTVSADGLKSTKVDVFRLEVRRYTWTSYTRDGTVVSTGDKNPNVPIYSKTTTVYYRATNPSDLFAVCDELSHRSVCSMPSPSPGYFGPSAANVIAQWQAANKP